jgi:hypothetical protein
LPDPGAWVGFGSTNQDAILGSLLGRFNSLLGRFNSLPGRFNSLFRRLGNFPLGVVENQ